MKQHKFFDIKNYGSSISFPKWKGIVLILIFFVSCDIVGKKSESESSEPPALPELELYQPNTDFFTNNSSKTDQDVRGFEKAAELISAIVQPDMLRTYVYLPFLARAEQAEPEFTNDQWEWKYSYTRQAQSFDVRLTAKEGSETSDNIYWMLYASNQDLSLNNYKLMNLSNSPEGSKGSWIIYPIESDSTELWLDWSLDTATDYEEFTFNFYVNGSGTQRTVIFTREGPAHSIETHIPGSPSDYIFVIQWNTDTNEGSVYDTESGERICWDENLNDIEC